MNNMDIGEYKIKLTGVANIPRPLKLGCSYDLEIKEVECRKTEQVPNDDGSMDEIAKLQISELSEVVLKSGDKTMKAKQKGGQSKLYRYLLQQLAEKKGLDPDKFYADKMASLIDGVKLELEV
jgi:hypothetical protein